MRPLPQRVGFAVLPAILALAGAAAPVAASGPAYTLQATLSDSSGVYSNLSGTVSVTDDTAAGTICYQISLSGLDELAAAGDSVSSVVLTDFGTLSADLGLPDANGFISGCLSGFDPTLPLAMATHPSRFVVEVSSSQVGVIMTGSLHPTVPTVVVNVTQYICPTIHAIQQFDAVGTSGCDWVTPPGSWTPNPSLTYTGFGGFYAFDYRILPPTTPAQTLASDGELSGGFACDASGTCIGHFSEEFSDVGAGATQLVETAYPSGFRCGAATVTTFGRGGQVTVPSAYVSGDLSFDTTGYFFVNVDLYAFAPNGTSGC